MERSVAVLMSSGDRCGSVRYQTRDAAATEREARERIGSHPHFRTRSSTIHVRVAGGSLVLSGRLPSFYLKQLAQEALRDLTPRIQNDIDVVCCSGLSSVQGGGAHN